MRRLLATTMSTLALAGAVPLAAEGYRTSAAIALPGDGGWDYAQVDAATKRLYVAHTDAVAAVDLATNTALPAFGPVAHAHAVVPLEHGRVLAVTSGGDATVRLFDTLTQRQLATIAVGEDPDAAIVDPATGHLLVMNAKAGTISDIDVARRRVARTIAVTPALEYAAIGRQRRLFVNNEDAGEIEVVNLATGRREAPVTMPGCEAPSGLAYDAPHDRLIAACGNGTAAIVDAGKRRLTQLVPIGRGPDAVILDARRARALVPCGADGTLAVLDLSGDTVTHTADVTTELGARTGAIDPATGEIFLPTARLRPPVPPAKRSTPLPGTFHLVRVLPS